MVGLPFAPQTRLKWLWVWFLPCAETPGLTPVLTGIKGNLSSAVNYVTGNYVQITIKVWVLSSSRKVPVYIHKLLLSSSLRLDISGAACELCAPHNFFFLIPVLGVSLNQRLLPQWDFHMPLPTQCVIVSQVNPTSLN